MPNQYTKVALYLETQNSNDFSHLEKQFTKAVFKVLSKKLSPNPLLIEEIISKIKKDL